ncbi:hypothetical protein [Neptunicella sp. SCSIO 80796]|uniref:hypothetical protein n=1 Tax=Neptunicella plasticusilytica TaxID=3117012 RepID=UPI003A4D6480
MKGSSYILASGYPYRALARILTILILLGISATSTAGSREQARQMHDRLVGIPPSDTVLSQMTDLIEQGDTNAAAYLAMENPAFYSVTLKNWITPWTNESGDVFQPLNDYTATVIGIMRDDIDFRQILSGDILYVADSALGLPSYANNSNAHYQAIEQRDIDLSQDLVASTQSAVTGLPAEATAGVLTTRAAAKAFFIDGTNRAMFRFTLINHLCTDLEALKDTSRNPDRIRQDVSRSPGGDSRIFMNACVGCHAGMDPLAQSFAYYNFAYQDDPENGALEYHAQDQLDPQTGSRVQAKYLINSNNFVHGYITQDDSWENYWRAGKNANLGWSAQLSGSGTGAKSMGEELANSDAFAQCQVKKVFSNVCLRNPEDDADRSQVEMMVNDFKTASYQLKRVFAESANYCKGS